MLSVSVRQSVTTFWEYFTNGSDDFNHFLHAAFIRMRRDDTKFRFGPKTIKGFFKGGGLGRLNLKIFINFYLPFNFSEISEFFCLTIARWFNLVKTKISKRGISKLFFTSVRLTFSFLQSLKRLRLPFYAFNTERIKKTSAAAFFCITSQCIEPFLVWNPSWYLDRKYCRQITRLFIFLSFFSPDFIMRTNTRLTSKLLQ